jgi:N-methylhydantoinase A
LTIPVKAGSITPEEIEEISENFHQSHERTYGFARRSEPVEFVNMRVVAWGKLPEMGLREVDFAEKEGQPTAERDVYFDGTDPVSSPVYQRDQLVKGQQLQGPAVVEQMDSTVLVFPGYKAETDPYGNLLITSL